MSKSGELTSPRVNPNDDAIEHQEMLEAQDRSSIPEDKYLNVRQTNGSQTMLRGWSGNTGPKGVLLDFKASHGKSGAILGGLGPTPTPTPTPSTIYARQTIGSKSPMIAHSRPTSPSASDSDASEERYPLPLFGSTKTTTRLNPHHVHQNSAGSTSNLRVDPAGRKLFGHLREVGVENFIHAIEAEKNDNQTVVLVHLYDPALESCVVLNTHLSNLARAHPRTKFLRALASEVDFFSGTSPETVEGRRFTIPSVKEVCKTRVVDLMDDDPFADNGSTRSGDEGGSRRATDTDVLPTLVWYRSGQYVQSLPALESRMPRGSIVRGEQGCKDLEGLLKRNGVINTS